MKEKEDVIEIITDKEELPTDVKKRILRISALTDDDKERITNLMNKLDMLISKTDDTQIINNIIDLRSKLTQIMVYISKLEEKIDTLPLDKQKLDYLKDEIKDYLAILSDEIQSSKRSFLSKLEELKKSVSDVAIDVTALDDINTAISEIRDDVKTTILEVKDDVNASISYIRDDINALMSEKVDKIETSVADMRDSATTTISNMGEDIKSSISDMREDIRRSISDISTRFYEIETSLSDKIDAIKGLAEQSSENIDKTLTALYVIRDVINKSSENIDISAENLKNISNTVSEKLNSLSNFVETVNSAREQLENNVKAMEVTRNDIEDYVSSLDKKTDDVLNVVYGKITELDSVKNELKNNIAKLDEGIKAAEDTNTKLEDNLTLLDDLRVNHKKTENEIKKINKKINKTTRDLKQNDNELKKSLKSLKAMEKGVKKKEVINRDVLNELKRFNIHLSKLDEAEFLFRIMEIKKRIKKYKKLPKWATERRDSLLKSVLLFEKDLIDISIIYALLKGDAHFTELRRITGIKENQLRNNLNKLVNEKRVRKYRKGRYVFYSITV